MSRQHHIQLLKGGSFPLEIKWLAHDANLLPPFTDNVKNKWSHVSTHLICLHGMCKYNFNFLIFLFLGYDGIKFLLTGPSRIASQYSNIIITFYLIIIGRDISVGITTRYGLDSPGIESRWGARFSTPVRTSPGAHRYSCRMGTGSLFRE
jgi:hypothetical protein